MKLIDPTVSRDVERNARAKRFVSLDGLAVGLLSNGKANAEGLLRETAKLFESKHGCRVTKIAHKQNASAPAPSEVIDELARECDLLLTASGD